MTNRVIEISEGPTRLRVENLQLIIEKKDSESSRSVPIEDLAAVVLATTQASYTHAVFSELAGHGVPVILCDGKSLPIALCAPITANALHPQVLRAQVSALAARPLMKRLWKEIVMAKIRAQSEALRQLDGEDGGLGLLARRVRSGDPSNVEAQAARLYWPRLFKDETFRRTPQESIPPNHLLNYGYAVLRGIVARAVVGAGLHPALGIQHHHRENAYALADDLMEAFRPLVDETAARMARTEGPDLLLNRERKAKLLAPLLLRYRYRDEARTLFDILSLIATRLVRIFEKTETELDFPETLPISDA